jgi:hypothetical protein
MKKLVVATMLAVFSVSAVTATAAMAKDKPGKCGTFKYFDKKTKKCVSKV